MAIKADFTVDAKGLSCPLPIVKAKKGMNEIDPGQVLELQATDRGSLADIQGWAKGTGHEYIGTREDGDVLKHYLRKASDEESKEEDPYPHTVDNEGLESKLNDDNVTVLDVRESAEYAFKHIPGAKSIPMGELENRTDELDKDSNIYVVCRTGNRSDMASKLLTEKGFENVVNVVPGMSEWNGPSEEEE